MRTRAIFAAILALCCCCAQALAALHVNSVPSKHAGRETRSEIETLERQWRDAMLSGDTKTMSKLLDDGYVGISANGVIEDKDETLAARTAGTVTFQKLDFEDVKVRMYASGSTAVVVSRAEVQGTNGGQDISGRYRFMRVYVKKLGQWKIVSFEASRMR